MADQSKLFDTGTWWEEHWQGMPEFVQKNIEPYKTLFVHFRNREDYLKFAALVAQNMTSETKSIWFPEAQISERLVYVDVSSADDADEDEQE